MNRRKIATLHHLPCSGGTIISKCLAAMKGVALLSEIHPDKTPFDPLRQLEQGYGLITTQQREERFADDIALVEKLASDAGKTLVVRDHTHVDFFRRRPPRRDSALIHSLSPRFDLRILVTLRHPLDAWLGMRAKDWIGDNIERYLRVYMIFLDAFAAFPLLKYEDFCVDPESFCKKLCELGDLPYDPDFRKNISKVNHMTGDSGRKSDEIGVRPRRPVDEEVLARFRKSRAFARISETTGYTL